MTRTVPDVSDSEPPGPTAPAPPTAADDDPLAHRRVTPLRHPGRWIATALVLVVVAQILHGLITNPFYQWDRFGYWFARPVIVDGLLVTLEVTAYSAVLGFVGGVILALMRMSKSGLLRSVSWVYIWLFRSIPLIVLLILIYNSSLIYPTLGFGIPFGPELTTFETGKLLSAMAMAVIGLSMNEAAYAAEVVRGGVLAVDQGQLEAASALGLSRTRQLRRIVLPQALRSIVPSYVNQLINLIKASSLVFYVSLLDLFGTAQTLQNTYTTDIVPLLVVASAWYVVMTSVLSVLQFYVERYYSKGALRTVPPTPLQRLRAQVGSVRARMVAETSIR